MAMGDGLRDEKGKLLLVERHQKILKHISVIWLLLKLCLFKYGTLLGLGLPMGYR